MFPDEVDTPMDTPARMRFQKYRGLKSFRTSPWDPKENLPANYARIFQFENFKRTEKKVRKDLTEKDGISVSYFPFFFVNCLKVYVYTSQKCPKEYVDLPSAFFGLSLSEIGFVLYSFACQLEEVAQILVLES